MSDRRGPSDDAPGSVGTVKFFYGPMDCGKSTLALQMDHNHARQGRSGLRLTRMDRSRPGQISSRMGIARDAVEVSDDLDLADVVRAAWAVGRRVDYLIVDEAQFFTPLQIEQLSMLADTAGIDVYAFGIATDFRGRLFPGSARLFELADEALLLQVEVLCWCGRPGRFNARVVDGEVVKTGETLVVADTMDVETVVETDVETVAEPGGETPTEHPVHYRVLCRAHHRDGDLGPTAGDGTLRLSMPRG